MTGDGDWLLLQELLERGDPEFVDRLRGVADAVALGAFAERWYASTSPNARRLLLAYLERPLDAYRHEALVKRLLKRAEAAGDDAVMARFLVAFDRSIRRARRARLRWGTRQVGSWEEVESLKALWRAEGSRWVRSYRSNLAGHHYVVEGKLIVHDIATPVGTSMPRGTMRRWYAYDETKRRDVTVVIADWVLRLGLKPWRYRDVVEVPEEVRKRLERFRLFSAATRHYLRRRAWRYFRRLGKTHPERYLAAISEALSLYEDADVDSGLALIDNWGLLHALFHHSRVLVAGRRWWGLAEGRTLLELEPAPIYEELWRSAPRAIFDLMARARCRPVRQWAVRMLRRDPVAVRAAVGAEEVVGLLGHDDPAVVEYAAEWLRGAEDLASVSPERWLAVAETASPGALDVLAEILSRQVAPEQVSSEAAARLATCRPLPLARLGLGWLKTKAPASDDERRGLLVLLEAECEPLRPEILAWLRSVLASGHEFHADWLLEFLDSRHADARAAGLSWFRDEARARDDVALWQRLLESPYDDVRLALTNDLDARLESAKGEAAVDLALALDADRLRLLWASVLLNVHRGSRAKPRVVEQVAHRLGRRPDEAGSLLPLLAVGLRSLRATERRAALAAVVRLVEERPEWLPAVRQSLPELQWA
jgi:hypothetical protein